ncbi:2-hydroxyacid dehydrogenase [Flavimarina sp. Hel_I_48]|uniref:2-hydroxyacid dehydrogenase n=1 Tax=Flavimarina sp. Hel_I_48 TaxID=1392488 RepID=UPI0004DF6A59|nr:glyoxylate/hydroxypyruvate reductase A [Flavimarina sp. Hel_I_48]
MSLLLIRNDKNYEPWLKAIKKIDPDFPVFTPESLKNKEDVNMILAWKAPHGSFDNYPNNKVIGSMGAGVDHLFEDPSLPENIKMTRIVDENLIGDMQEFVLAQTLNAIKNLNTYTTFQKEHNWKPIPYKRAPDVTVGIMGLGVLGEAVAKTLHRNNFKLTGWANSKKDIDGLESFAGDEQLDDFLATTEILVCLLPLTEETKNILNKNLFKKLPDNAYIINVARGGHVVDDDLTEALKNGKLSGAALDVFHTEPLPEDHPFWDNEKILITPHTASKSDPSSIADQVVENYKRLQSGEELKNTVSREKNY